MKVPRNLQAERVVWVETMQRESELMLLVKVRAFIERLSPHAVCGDCIADRLDLSSRGVADQKIRELAAQPRFERGVENCDLCRAEKRVIRYV